LTAGGWLHRTGRARFTKHVQRTYIHVSLLVTINVCTMLQYMVQQKVIFYMRNSYLHVTTKH